MQSAKGTDIQHTPCRAASTRARRAPSGWCAWKAPVAAWTSTELSASLCTDACTAQEVVIVEPLTFSVLFSLVCCSALAPWCSEACTTQLVVIVERLMFSVLFSSRSPQLVVIVEPLMFSVLFSCMISLVRLAPLLAALHGRRLGTHFASLACRHCASRADSLRRRCLLLYWPCSSKLRRALSDFERPLPFTPSSWLLLRGILRACVAACACLSAGRRTH